MEQLQVIEIDGESWAWPANDKKLILVFKHRTDIQEILKHVKKFDVCVQAGGATGVWPVEFADHFEQVYTFEPDPTNYAALEKNIQERSIENINHKRAALGDDDTVNIKIIRDPCHVDNYGAGYAVPGGDTPCIKIDSLELESCGLIQLDIEGYELKALKGAVNTIKKYKPVIVLEVKPHPQLGGRSPREAADYLLSLGYKETAHFHRDILFTC